MAPSVQICYNSANYDLTKREQSGMLRDDSKRSLEGDDSKKSLESDLRKIFSDYFASSKELINNKLFFIEYAGSIENHYGKDSRQDGITYDGYLLHANRSVVKVTHNVTAGKREKAYLLKKLPPIQTIAAGTNFGLFLDLKGGVWIYDENVLRANQATHYMLGRQDELKPQRLDMNVPVIAIAACERHCLMLTEEGKVLALGANESGQLGFPDKVTIFRPTEIPNLKDIRCIATDATTSYFSDTETCFSRGQFDPRKKIVFQDKSHHLWKINGFSYIFPTNKHVSLKVGAEKLVELPEVLFQISHPEDMPVQFGNFLSLFRQEIYRFEQIFLNMYLKNHGWNFEIMNLIAKSCAADINIEHSLAMIFLHRVASLSANQLQDFIHVGIAGWREKKEEGSYFIPALLRLLQIQHYLLQHHEKDNHTISTDQKTRINDFVDLLFALANEDVINHMSHLIAYLAETDERNGLQYRKFNAMLFSISVPHHSTVYYNTRQKLVFENENEACQKQYIQDLRLVARHIIHHIHNLDSSSLLIKALQSAIRVRMTTTQSYRPQSQ